MADLLLAKEVNAKLNEVTSAGAMKLTALGITPTLAIVRVGEKEDDLSYERGATKRCESLGIRVLHRAFPDSVTTRELLTEVQSLNEDKNVHGVLILKPLPAHIDESAVCNTLAAAKDVDGITDSSAFAVYAGRKEGYAPCTACAVMAMLSHYGYEPSGKKAVVIGRSQVIGRPVAMMLLSANATVTICHSRTKNLPQICKEADILVAAAGSRGMVDETFVNDSQIILDVGIHVNEEGKLCGDVLPEAAELAKACTTVPGGVGGVTTSILAGHVVDACRRLNHID